jgi:cell division protein FtsW
LDFLPSEIAKFAFVLFCSWYMTLPKVDMTRFVYALPVLGVGLLGCLLIILEPNMSITVCFGLTMLVMLYLGGTKIKTMLAFILPLAVAFPCLIIFEPYRMQRLLAFINPWASPKDEGYQLIQSLYALGSGGWFGVGLFNSRQKMEFLPFAESDFVFSIIGEETGLMGALFVCILFGVLIYRGVRIAVNAESRYKGLVAAGITAVIAIQTLINIAVVTGSIPPTGLPLPFISYGGTALVVFMSASGILFNISKKPLNTI